MSSISRSPWPISALSAIGGATTVFPPVSLPGIDRARAGARHRCLAVHAIYPVPRTCSFSFFFFFFPARTAIAVPRASSRRCHLLCGHYTLHTRYEGEGEISWQISVVHRGGRHGAAGCGSSVFFRCVFLGRSVSVHGPYGPKYAWFARESQAIRTQSAACGAMPWRIARDVGGEQPSHRVSSCNGRAPTRIAPAH